MIFYVFDSRRMPGVKSFEKRNMAPFQSVLFANLTSTVSRFAHVSVSKMQFYVVATNAICIQQLLLLSGLGSMRPNMFMINWYDMIPQLDAKQYVQIIQVHQCSTYLILEEIHCVPS